MTPQTHYARSGEIDIAYQVVGDGPIDLVVVSGWISNLEVYWEEPNWARFTLQLASFARVILFDKRGTGLSDRSVGMPTLEERMDDVRAVMDAVGSPRAALFGWSEGGPMSALFAATYPERTLALIIAGGYARRLATPGYPGGTTPEQLQASIDTLLAQWGTSAGLAQRCASKAGDAQFEQWWGRFLRMSASPQAGVGLLAMNAQIDIRHVLPAISVPTLILHARGDPVINVAEGQYLADHIPSAKFVPFEGVDHIPFVQGSELLAEQISEFLTGAKAPADIDRVLATVMFTDIVGATDRAAALGDRQWHDLLQSHHAQVRRELLRYRGTEIDTAGDGFFAAFDGPARAVRCGKAITQSVRTLALSVRVGIHTGECEIIGEKYGGIAVHTGARIAALADAGEVLVSNTVKDLVAGSGLTFADCGERALKGIPGTWRLYSLA